LTTKIHLLADELGLPVDFLITAGQVNDCTQAIEQEALREGDILVVWKLDRLGRSVKNTRQYRPIAEGAATSRRGLRVL
jgi:hypothetical protein